MAELITNASTKPSVSASINGEEGEGARQCPPRHLHNTRKVEVELAIADRGNRQVWPTIWWKDVRVFGNDVLTNHVAVTHGGELLIPETSRGLPCWTARTGLVCYLAKTKFRSVLQDVRIIQTSSSRENQSICTGMAADPAQTRMLSNGSSAAGSPSSSEHSWPILFVQANG